MALITSAQTGNFNQSSTWTGGVIPTTGDEARASNGHTITITANATCDEVSNAGTGIFTLNDGVTLTANVTNKSTTTSRNCLQFTAASPASATIVGNCTGGSVTNASAVANTNNGTLNITGNVNGGTGTFSSGNGAVLNSSGGTINITGNSTGGSISGTAIATNNSSSGTINITGNCTGGSATSCFGVRNNGTGTVTITGNATGGSIAGAFGADNNSTGTITITGNAIASTAAIGASNNSTGILSVVRAVGNSWGIGAAGGITSAVGLASGAAGSDTRAQELEYGTNGQAPTSGAVRIVGGTNNKAFVTLTTSVVKTLSDPSDGTGQANEADVRLGVSYALGNRTGTCAVPAASSVAAGVAVGTGVGTAVLTQANVWDYALSSASSVAGSVGQKLAKAATPADIVALS